ncbi:MAG: CatB-related O-acetyltransferase [Clostridiales bacterium]|nr:CatB-related O-acetyltransferase [Clostridiales bacterium]
MFPLDKVNVGNGTYGELNVHAFGDENEGLSIGNYCSIAENVHFLLGGNHPMDTLSTYPFREYILKTASEKLLVHQTGSKGTITVSDDVWIGHGTIVLSGVHIGQGAVIGAGSIVTKDIPPYAIFAGGNVRRFRFEQDVIDKMVHIHYAGFGEKELEKLKGIIDQPVTEKNVDEIIELLRNP